MRNRTRSRPAAGCGSIRPTWRTRRRSRRSGRFPACWQRTVSGKAHSEFPVDLIVILPAARGVAGYSLAAGELSERMPVSWELDGSLDGARWVALDRQPRIPRWHANETRSFRIAVQGSSRLLRFRFLAGQDPRIMRIYKIALQ